MREKNKPELVKNKGQAALIILLVVAVTLGFGLSIVSQSTTDTRISKQEEDASRAFNAAEAGIEAALKQIGSIPIGVGNNLEVDGIDVNYVVNSQEYVQGVYTENETVQVWLGGSVNGDLVIEWGDEGYDCSGATATSGGTEASLLLSVMDSNEDVRRIGINACDIGATNGLALEATAADTDGYLRKHVLTVDSNDMYVRIRPLYSQTKIFISSSESLPVQTYVVDSSAKVTEDATPDDALASKGIKVTRSEPATPSIFDYVLFSGTNIIK